MKLWEFAAGLWHRVGEKSTLPDYHYTKLIRQGVIRIILSTTRHSKINCLGENMEIHGNCSVKRDKREDISKCTA